jgi:hypothetical protein
MLEQVMKETPIAACSADFQRRIRPMVPLGKPDGVTSPPINIPPAPPGEIPLLC